MDDERKERNGTISQIHTVRIGWGAKEQEKLETKNLFFICFSGFSSTGSHLSAWRLPRRLADLRRGQFKHSHRSPGL
jgi:hypothetical protein